LFFVLFLFFLTMDKKRGEKLSRDYAMELEFRKFERKNSQGYHYMVCNGATNCPVGKGLMLSKFLFQFHLLVFRVPRPVSNRKEKRTMKVNVYSCHSMSRFYSKGICNWISQCCSNGRHNALGKPTCRCSRSCSSLLE